MCDLTVIHGFAARHLWAKELIGNIPGQLMDTSNHGGWMFNRSKFI
ncbi:hypothetical protein [Escherichia fergusonii]|nr:hypothetical protein [Escherichia fergusonii]MBA8266866.1 hypothetical protein [Escherichia fergusonii]MBZ4079796.1 hypothetical protein [Escherichia fergusonii]MBZ4131858.1 hypothetical protein [Escherichia fergusonii]MCP9696136.1 hypothetical protein [Escherichia fergusonii]QMB00671.1 hypothetical protein HV012_06425 [Escherichia fergusonii]